MPKMTPTLDLAAYTPVAERIRLFYERFPAGRIVTELVSRESADGATVITFRALAYRAPTDTLPAATGWAAERDDDGEVNAVACLENAETSAIGRALANLGFATSARPSREEMAKANRARLRLADRSAPRGPRRPAQSPAPTERSRAARDSIVEVLSLADELVRADVAPERIRRLRHRITTSPPSVPSLARVERLLGRWLDRLDG
ncbi:MAG: hypothetical protein HOQ09_07580 [Gemmatimonadaceae bacterium]|nr:hypothetical protein [Gemmatimonadaceae bacterium]